MSEFLKNLIKHARFKKSLQNVKLSEIELFVASLGRVSLLYGRKELVSRRSGLLEFTDDQVLDKIITIGLEQALNKHRMRPCFVMISLENFGSSNLETKIDNLLLLIVKY